MVTPPTDSPDDQNPNSELKMRQRIHELLANAADVGKLVETGFHSALGILFEPTTVNVVAPSAEQIAKLAYCIWEAEGCPNGRDITHWLEAEARLRALLRNERNV